MKVIAVIERGDNGTYGVHAPELQNVFFGEGATVSEAREDFLNSYHEMVLSYLENDRPIPDELQNLEFEYKYDISAFFNMHPYLNASKVAQYIGINDTLMRQYKRGQYISQAQLNRIQGGIHEIGRELASVSLFK